MWALWIILVLIAVTAGVVVVARRRRKAIGPGAGAIDSGWRPAIAAAATSLGGRPSIAGGTAEMRAEQEGVTVTLRVRGDVATADAPLYPNSKAPRIYLASGLEKPSQDLGYMPETPLPPAFALDPPVMLRTDGAEEAVKFAEANALELAKLERDSGARSIEVLVRGGSLELTLRNARASTDIAERMVRTSARLVAWLGGNRALAEASTKQIPAATVKIACALCGGERRPGVDWVKCTNCGSPHHAECWNTAHECAREGCGGTRAEPMA